MYVGKTTWSLCHIRSSKCSSVTRTEEGKSQDWYGDFQMARILGFQQLKAVWVKRRWRSIAIRKLDFKATLLMSAIQNKSFCTVWAVCLRRNPWRHSQEGHFNEIVKLNPHSSCASSSRGIRPAKALLYDFQFKLIKILTFILTDAEFGIVLIHPFASLHENVNSPSYLLPFGSSFSCMIWPCHTNNNHTLMIKMSLMSLELNSSPFKTRFITTSTTATSVEASNMMLPKKKDGSFQRRQEWWQPEVVRTLPPPYWYDSKNNVTCVGLPAQIRSLWLSGSQRGPGSCQRISWLTAHQSS